MLVCWQAQGSTLEMYVKMKKRKTTAVVQNCVYMKQMDQSRDAKVMRHL